MTTTNGVNRDRLALAIEGFTHFIRNATTQRRDAFRDLFDPRRNVEDEAGLPRLSEPINPEEYRQFWERNPYAARVVEVLAKESWQVQPQIYEEEDGEEATAFEV